MPAKLDRCVKKVIKQGKKEKEAWPICINSLRSYLEKHGYFKHTKKEQ